jgi:hypothetical protein
MGIDFVPYPYPPGKKTTVNTHPSVKTTQQGNIIAQHRRKTKSYISFADSTKHHTYMKRNSKTSHIYEKKQKNNTHI